MTYLHAILYICTYIYVYNYTFRYYYISHRIHGSGIYMLTWLGYIDGIHVTIYSIHGSVMGIYIYITRILTFLHLGIGTASWSHRSRAKLRGLRGVCSDDRPAPDQGEQRLPAVVVWWWPGFMVNGWWVASSYGVYQRVCHYIYI